MREAGEYRGSGVQERCDTGVGGARGWISGAGVQEGWESRVLTARAGQDVHTAPIHASDKPTCVNKIMST